MNHTLHIAISMCVAVCSDACFAQPYKCVVDGKTVYQQAKCEGGQTVNTTGAGAADPASPASLQVRRDIAAMKRKEIVENAILSGSIVIGMTQDEVVQSWGLPSKVNKTVTGSGTSEQWIYRRAKIGYDQYVYLDNGIVRSIQSAE